MYTRKYVVDPVTVLLILLMLLVLILAGIITPENAAAAVQFVQKLRG